ncbi:MAG: hypothetical protein EBR82_72145 [Caulobacteraceae bacterium]|nr:hypothetical protein [Caulobacteraceae bacterium]
MKTTKQRLIKLAGLLAEGGIYVKNFNNVKEDQVGTFYVVTNKLGNSDTLIDIMFESDVFHFANQVRGGLSMEDVYGLYKDKNKATQAAKSLLGQ